tara:strand:+ start:497 stop:856 length:360 start_codon:yes stop_codon:yes gene_type:complete
MNIVNLVYIGFAHAVIRDMSFLGLYNIFALNSIIGRLEMILCFLIPLIVSPLLISKIFKIRIFVPLIISIITLIVPNFIPNVIILTHYKENKDLIVSFTISIVSYTLLYLIAGLFKFVK